MSGLNPDWSEEAVRFRCLQKTSRLPPEARPGSATQERADAIEEQIGLRAQAALRCPPKSEYDSNIS